MEYDVIVIGLGAMGSSTTYQLAKKGKKVLGIDQHDPPHTLGSSHGESRIIRKAIAEGEEYVPLVLRSYEIWKELEKESGEDLLTETGILIMASNATDKPNKFLDSTKLAAEHYSIKHRNLDAGDVQKEFSQFKLQGDEKGYFEDEAGFLRPELCVSTQLRLAKRHGAGVQVNEKLLSYEADENRVTVTTDKGTYHAKQIVLTVGPRIKDFLPEQYEKDINIYRQVLYWFEVEGNADKFRLGNFPVFNWEFNTAHEDFIYGFPIIDGSNAVKLATEQYADTTNPDEVDREVSEVEIKNMYEQYVKPYMPDLTSNCVRAEACMYSVAPDWGFVIDRHPEHHNVVIASPCSGHGFKHSAAIGEVLADLSTDSVPKVDISRFSFSAMEDRLRHTK
jgi:sarcosine oxidase